MFERYNEKARRTIFFARYEASLFGTPEIESEHLLLGILREGKTALNPILGIDGIEAIRAQIEASDPPRGKTSTSVDLPLTLECKRILAYGAEEAQRLHQKHIGIEHLLLGILREDKCLAAQILQRQGIRLDKARTLVSASTERLAITARALEPAPNQVITGRFGIEVQLVDAFTAETLLTYRTTSEVPRMGESILVRAGDGTAQSYKIQDVVWELEEAADTPHLQRVSMRVLKLG